MEQEKDRIAEALDEVRNRPTKLQRFESVVLEAGRRIAAPDFPEEHREAARAEVVGFIRAYVEQQRDPVFDQLARDLGRALGRLAVPPPSPTPDGEIDRNALVLGELYFPIEIDQLRVALQRGERILSVGPRAVKTDKREIDRFNLRKFRPSSIQGEKFVEIWERQFPSRSEIDAQHAEIANG